MIEPRVMLDEIAELHHELPKLFALPLYELPTDVRSYYISDRRRKDEVGYEFDLFMLRATSLSWVSIKFDNAVLDRRVVRTFPLERLARVEIRFEGATGVGMTKECTVHFVDGFVLSLPLASDWEDTRSGGRDRALAFGRSIQDAL